MISRKKFIKISSLSALALGSGFSLGKLIPNSSASRFAVYGFLPSSDRIISRIVKAFQNKTKDYSTPTIIADEYYVKLIKSHYNSSLGFFNLENATTYRISKIKHPINSDIILNDNRNSIHSLNNDFDREFSHIRSDINGANGTIFFSAEFNQKKIVSSLLNFNERNVVIENESGIVEKIPIGDTYKNISINGSVGRTSLELKNNSIRVVKPSCRHKLCERAGLASFPGDIIACAPNKLLIRIEEV